MAVKRKIWCAFYRFEIQKKCDQSQRENKDQSNRIAQRQTHTHEIKRRNKLFNNVKDTDIMTILSVCNGCHDVCLPEKV